MKYILTTTFSLFALVSTAQTYEHIKFTYDAAGNRVHREYFPSTPQVDPDLDNKDDEATEDQTYTDDTKNTVASRLENDAPSTINLYPNPTKNNIEINIGNRFNPDLDQSFELIDLNGKVVKTYPINQSVNMLKLGGIRSAMYYVHYKENGVIVESWKVVKID
jgi:hypothetical protein